MATTASATSSLATTPLIDFFGFVDFFGFFGFVDFFGFFDFFGFVGLGFFAVCLCGVATALATTTLVAIALATLST